MSVVEESVPSNHVRATHRRKLPHILFGLTHSICIWIERRRQRRVLIALDDRLLADAGLSREQARREAAKPFWKG
jgi:uncharacterized protein YjiS (DUF1127 family)